MRRDKAGGIAIEILFWNFFLLSCNFILFRLWIMDCNKATMEYFHSTAVKIFNFPALGNDMSY